MKEINILYKNLENDINSLNNVVKNTIINEQKIHDLFIIIVNIVSLIKELVRFFYIIIDKYVLYKTSYIRQLESIMIEFNINNSGLINRYNYSCISTDVIQYKNIIKNYLECDKKNDKKSKKNKFIYNYK